MEIIKNLIGKIEIVEKDGFILLKVYDWDNNGISFKLTPKEAYELKKSLEDFTMKSILKKVQL